MPARDISRVIPVAHQHLPRSIRQRLGHDVGGREVTNRLRAGKDDGFGAGQHLRPALRRLAVRQRDQLFRGPPLGRDATEGRSRGARGRKNNRSVITPAATAANRRVAERDGGAAGHGDFLEFPEGEESNPFSIWRKEGIQRAFGSRQGRGLQLIEPAHIQRHAVSEIAAADKREERSIRGKDRGGAEHIDKRGIGADVGGEAHGTCGKRRRRPRTPHGQCHGQRRKRDERDGRDQPGAHARSWARRDGRRVRGRQCRSLIEQEPDDGDVAEPRPAIFLEAAFQQRAQVRRDIRGKRRPVGLAAHHRGNDIGEIFAVKGARPGEHFVEHAAERPDVAALVGRLSLRLLGAHVDGRPENDAGVGGHRRRGDRG